MHLCSAYNYFLTNKCTRFKTQSLINSLGHFSVLKGILSFQQNFWIFFSRSFRLSLPVVKNKKAHNGNLMFRQFLAMALLLVVLFSSCSLKRGIKVLFDIPVKMEQTGTFGHFISPLGQAGTACLKCTDFQVLTSDAFDHSMIKNLSSAILLTIVFSLLLLPLFRSEETHNFKTPRLGRSIPKYLLFNKLLFYDLR